MFGMVTEIPAVFVMLFNVTVSLTFDVQAFCVAFGQI